MCFEVGGTSTDIFLALKTARLWSNTQKLVATRRTSSLDVRTVGIGGDFYGADF